MSRGVCLYWIRRDLRLRDNPALRFAVKEFDAVVPIYIWGPQEESPWEPGAASRWWLHHSLAALDAAYRAKGCAILFRQGTAFEQLKALIEETDATALVWNRLYDPKVIERDKHVKQGMREQGVQVQTFNASLLVEPWELSTSSNTPYQVFTPFWKKLQQEFTPAMLLSAPKRCTSVDQVLHSDALKDFDLLPQINWTEGLHETWVPGEDGAQKRLRRFLKNQLSSYGDARNNPADEATSNLSPHLHFGELSPLQIWHAVQGVIDDGTCTRNIAEPFLRQLAWRDFAHNLLFHFPNTPEHALHSKFEAFPWKPNKDLLDAWQEGRTGYPFVDAGMRELWHTGTMHNRVRMVVASFLVKHLLQPWQDGAAWFWDTLVDADLANNTMGWQWTAGCGADAAPYFRVFNPFGQGQRFDPQGNYTRRWLPELADLPNAHIHTPWEAPHAVLEAAGVVLGKDYPAPIIEHKEGRERALEAYEEIKS